MGAPRTSSRELLLVAVLAIAHVCAPAVGFAQLDHARELLAEAQFDRAIRAYDEALAGPLDRAQYVEALDGRAMASWATGREERARADLVALAEIDPAHRFPLEAPPDLTTLFESIVSERAGPLALDARWSDDGALVVSIVNDDASLAQALRAHLDRGDVVESVVAAGTTTVELPLGGAREARSAWVELVGPSGAVLATAGDAARPLVRPRADPPLGVLAATDPSLAPEDRDPSGTGDRDLWIALGVSAGALVVIGVVVGVAVGVAGNGAAPDTMQPGAPVVVWP